MFPSPCNLPLLHPSLAIIIVTEPDVSPTIPIAALMQPKIGLPAATKKILNIAVGDILEDEGCAYNGKLGTMFNTPNRGK